MAPKRQRVSSAGDGSSRPAAFDAVRFLGPAQEARYRELEERNVWTERIIRLRERGHYHTPYVVLENYGLGVLCEPQTKVNVELVREFYANALPAEGVNLGLLLLCGGSWYLSLALPSTAFWASTGPPQRTNWMFTMSTWLVVIGISTC